MFFPHVLRRQEGAERAVAVEEAPVALDGNGSVVPAQTHIDRQPLGHADVVLHEHAEEVAADLELAQAEIEERRLRVVVQCVRQRVVRKPRRVGEDAAGEMNAEKAAELQRMPAFGLGEVLLEGGRRAGFAELPRLPGIGQSRANTLATFKVSN